MNPDEARKHFNQPDAAELQRRIAELERENAELRETLEAREAALNAYHKAGIMFGVKTE